MGKAPTVNDGVNREAESEGEPEVRGRGLAALTYLFHIQFMPDREAIPSLYTAHLFYLRYTYIPCLLEKNFLPYQ